MTDSASAAPGETSVAVVDAPPRRAAASRRQPRYHVVLWNDDDHTYDYVVAMLRRLFGHPPAQGFALAREVDTRGRAIVLTTTREHAELKRDQIRAFGADRLLARSRSSMTASIEAEPG